MLFSAIPPRCTAGDALTAHRCRSPLPHISAHIKEAIDASLRAARENMARATQETALGRETLIIAALAVKAMRTFGTIAIGEAVALPNDEGGGWIGALLYKSSRNPFLIGG